MNRYFLELAYKGTSYCGWQIQQNAISVQEILNKALATLLRHDIETIGCGRTDTGVHASQFYAHFDTETTIPSNEKFCYQMNALLPDDISVFQIIPVEANAHARFDATSRSYRYFITNEKNAFLKDVAWYWRTSPDVSLMKKAAEILITYTDFSCFAKAGGQQFTNHCTILNADWIAYDHILEFRITANRFLRGMVRAITGTMLEVGQQKINLEEFENIIRSQNRSLAGESVPAHGLFLSEIEYPYINKTQRKILLNA